MTDYKPTGTYQLETNEDGQLVFEGNALDTNDLLEDHIQYLTRKLWEKGIENDIYYDGDPDSGNIKDEWWINFDVGVPGTYTLNDLVWYCEKKDDYKLKNEIKRAAASEDIDERWKEGNDYFWKITDEWRTEFELTGEEMESMGLLDTLNHKDAKEIIGDTWMVKMTHIDYKEDKDPAKHKVTKKFEWEDGRMCRRPLQEVTITYDRDSEAHRIICLTFDE